MSDGTRSSATKPAPAPKHRAPPRPGARGVPLRVARFLGSFGLAVTILLVLMVIVLYGTFAQGWMSLYDVQQRYFGSWFTVLDLGGVPVPWPGGLLALTALSVNLVVGGLIRIRKGWATAGILVAHSGILLLFGGSMVESLWSDKGQMTVWEGDTRGEFQSYDEWEIVVRERTPSGGAVEWILASRELSGLVREDLRRFTNDRLPFDVAVTGWERNAEPRLARPGSRADSSAEGWLLEALAPAKTSDDTNLPGCWVTLVPKGGGPSVRTLLWGGQSYLDRAGTSTPWVATVAGRRFEVDLRTRRWTLPFSLELTQFVHKRYPGIGMDRQFSSYVRKHEDGTSRDVHITMNEPLRHRGYTLYQSSWGPSDAKEGERRFSVFAVVRNPSDRVPWIAVGVIFVGLLFQFGRRLVLHIGAEHAKRKRTASVANAPGSAS